MIDERSLIGAVDTALHLIAYAFAIAHWVPWLEVIGTALISAAIGYRAYPLATAWRERAFRSTDSTALDRQLEKPAFFDAAGYRELDDTVVTHACLTVLDKAILLARVLVGRRGRERGVPIDPADASHLYDLLDAVHNIPNVVASAAPSASFLVHSGLLQRGLDDYDAKWARAR